MSDETSGKAQDRLVYDMLGESAKYLGKEAFLPFTQYAVESIKRIVAKAKKRSAELGIEGGSVSSRILPEFVRGASVCEDDVVQSYLGGVLCSARTTVARDDRAMAALKLLSGLSSYAVRAHCIVYGSLLRQTDHNLADVGRWLTRGNGLTLLVNETELQKRMQFVAGENPDAILEHAFVNLSANDLCMQGIRSMSLRAEPDKMRFMHPTLRGVELFCWGTGIGQLGVEGYFANATRKAEVEQFAVTPRELKLGHVSYS